SPRIPIGLPRPPRSRRRTNTTTDQPKKKAGEISLTGLRLVTVKPALDGLEICRLGAACIRHHVEGPLLAFVQGAHAGSFNSGGVHEHVLAAAFRRDKAEALG